MNLSLSSCRWIDSKNCNDDWTCGHGLITQMHIEVHAAFFP